MSLVFILLVALASCSEEQKPVTRSDSAKSKVQRPQMTITEVLKKYTDEWMEIPGVVGTGEGRSEGKPAIIVFVEEQNETIEEKIPKSADGYTVVIEVTGKFEAR